METTRSSRNRPPLFKRHIALPQDHGSWVFMFSPLLIGIFVAGSWSIDTFIVVAATLAVFLIRQPVTIIVKIYSGRRDRRELGAAWFWFGVYGVIGLLALLGLFLQGFGYLLYLAIPGIPVFIWHLKLISRREERRQLGIEIVGSGVLALAAPAAYWVGVKAPAPTGWILFVLVWLQSAASIVYAYLRLGQRQLKTLPSTSELFRLGRRTVMYTTFNLVLVIGLSIAAVTPGWLFLPYALQWVESIQGVFRPAMNIKPTTIGVRQLIVSSLFTLLFIVAWKI